MKWAMLPLAAALLSGCGATHVVKFDYWRGLPEDVAAQLKRAELPFPKDQVFKAASDVLGHEPFFAWDYDQLDEKNGLIQASAGASRLMTLKVADAGGDSAAASARVSISLPKGSLSGQKDVWISKSDAFIVTAYDIDFSKRMPWRSARANFELTGDYLVSAIYRQLTDKSAVPFVLDELGQKSGLSAGQAGAAQ